MMVAILGLALLVGVLLALRAWGAQHDDNDDDDEGPGHMRRIRVRAEARSGPRNSRRR